MNIYSQCSSKICVGKLLCPFTYLSGTVICGCFHATMAELSILTAALQNAECKYLLSVITANLVYSSSRRWILSIFIYTCVPAFIFTF